MYYADSFSRTSSPQFKLAHSPALSRSKSCRYMHATDVAYSRCSIALCFPTVSALCRQTSSSVSVSCSICKFTQRAHKHYTMAAIVPLGTYYMLLSCYFPSLLHRQYRLHSFSPRHIRSSFFSLTSNLLFTSIMCITHHSNSDFHQNSITNIPPFAFNGQGLLNTMYDQ